MTKIKTDPTDVAEDTLYAFWSYDLYPYILGSVVTRIQGEGLVETKGFGKGSWFRPELIVPVEQGRELAKKIKELQVEQHDAKEEFDARWMRKMREAVHGNPALVALLRPDSL